MNKPKIKCLELNRIFNSIAEASKIIGISYGSIHRAVTKKQRTAGKYHWEYVNE